MTKRISFHIHGHVQGVTYRSFTRKRATAYNLTGWVRNTDASTVRGEAQGASSDLESLLADLAQGPRRAVVEKIEREDVEVVEGEMGFEVRG